MMVAKEIMFIFIVNIYILLQSIGFKISYGLLFTKLFSICILIRNIIF